MNRWTLACELLKAYGYDPYEVVEFTLEARGEMQVVTKDEFLAANK